MNKAPAFQFYAKDWLSSQSIQLMSPAEEGGYIRLLCYCWDSGDCSLPDDDEVLARLSRLGDHWNREGRNSVKNCFAPHPTKAGYLTNNRLLEVFNKQKEWSRKSSEGGKKGSATRWRKPGKKTEIKGAKKVVITKASPTPVQKMGVVIACSLPVDDSSSASSFATSDHPLPPSRGDGNELFERFWAMYPRKVAKPKAEKAFRNIDDIETVHEAIIAGLERWRHSPDWAKDNGQFIPHPATFLSQKRWQDDPRPEPLNAITSNAGGFRDVIPPPGTLIPPRD